ncbi:MAG: hypothetical protein JO166_12400 [Deltaproteobacteria bacterium]|nr:hypothetical protein [Deltaproteobacteria bacterium]
MIPLDSGNLRDFVLACVIGVSFYALVRLPHYDNEIWSRMKICQHVYLGEKKTRWGVSTSSQAGKEEVQQESPLAQVKFRPERR